MKSSSLFNCLTNISKCWRKMKGTGGRGRTAMSGITEDFVALLEKEKANQSFNLFSSAALTNSLNSGCAFVARDFNSG